MTRGITLDEPIALNLETGATPDVTDVPLVAGSVGADMEIWQESEGPKKFRVSLHRKPWPEVGNRISFSFESMEFSGVVTRTRQHAMHGRDRFYCDIEGTVETFTASDVFGG
jgi:hypothetical protein